MRYARRVYGSMDANARSLVPAGIMVLVVFGYVGGWIVAKLFS